MGDETTRLYSGDWSFIPAGQDHSLVAEDGKEVYYIWFEHFAREKDFIVKPDPQKERCEICRRFMQLRRKTLL